MSDWAEGFNFDELYGGTLPQDFSFNLPNDSPFIDMPTDDLYGGSPIQDFSLGGIDFSGGGGAGNWLGTALKALGLGNKDGSLNLGSLLPMLLAAGSGAYAMNRTNKATDQTVNAINSANEQITGLLGGAKSLYDPYVSAGTGALNKLSTQAPSNLADRYKPLAGQGGVTLTRFAKGK